VNGVVYPYGSHSKGKVILLTGPVWPRGWVEAVALEGTRRGQQHAPAALYPRERPILQEAGLAPGPVWTGGKSRPHRDSIPNRPARRSVAVPTELPGPRFPQ